MASDRARPFTTVLAGVILPLAVLTAVMIGLGFLVTHVLVHLWPFTIEDRVVDALVAERTPARDHVSNVVSRLAYTAGIATTLVVAGGLMRIGYHRWRESLFLVAALVCQLVAFKLTAWTVARPRPGVPQLDVFPPMQSFPSGRGGRALRRDRPRCARPFLTHMMTPCLRLDPARDTPIPTDIGVPMRTSTSRRPMNRGLPDTRAPRPWMRCSSMDAK